MSGQQLPFDALSLDRFKFMRVTDHNPRRAFEMAQQRITLLTSSSFPSSSSSSFPLSLSSSLLTPSRLSQNFIAGFREIVSWRLHASRWEQEKKFVSGAQSLGDIITTTEEYSLVRPGGGHAMMVVHGGSLFLEPANIDALSKEWMEGGLELDLAEGYYFQIGIFKSEKTFPVFPYDSFVHQKNLPKTYGVYIDTFLLDHVVNGLHPTSSFYNHPIFIARCGGKEVAHAYLDMLVKNEHTNFHLEFNLDTSNRHMGYLIRTKDMQSSIPFCGNMQGMNATYLCAYRRIPTEHRGGYRDSAKSDWNER